MLLALAVLSCAMHAVSLDPSPGRLGLAFMPPFGFSPPPAVSSPSLRCVSPLRTAQHRCGPSCPTVGSLECCRALRALEACDAHAKVWSACSVSSASDAIRSGMCKAHDSGKCDLSGVIPAQHAVYACGEYLLEHGQLCDVVCAPGYHNQQPLLPTLVTCNNGVMSASNIRCEADGCALPNIPPANAVLVPTPGCKWGSAISSANHTCPIACSQGFSLTSGTSAFECSGGGLASPTATCKANVCLLDASTSRLHFLPCASPPCPTCQLRSSVPSGTVCAAECSGGYYPSSGTVTCTDSGLLAKSFICAIDPCWAPVSTCCAEHSRCTSSFIAGFHTSRYQALTGTVGSASDLFCSTYSEMVTCLGDGAGCLDVTPSNPKMHFLWKLCGSCLSPFKSFALVCAAGQWAVSSPSAACCAALTALDACYDGIDDHAFDWVFGLQDGGTGNGVLQGMRAACEAETGRVVMLQ